MAFVIGDRVLETTTTTGTGTITLAGAVSGYRAFSTVATANNDTFYYQISGATEWEVGLGTRASATTFTRTTVFASSNGGALVNFSAGTKEVWMDAAAEQLRLTMNLNAHPSVFNGSIKCTVAGNAATFAVLTEAGATPSGTDPVFLVFQTAGGLSTVVRVAAALTITVASGATMGFANNTPGRIWLAVLLNAGVAELIVRNCTGQFGQGNGNAVGGFGTGVISTTAQAGAADDSFLVSYSVTARSSVPFFILGYFDWDDTPLATAGTWSSTPNKTVMWGPHVPLPGSVIQTKVNATATTVNSSSSSFTSVVTVSLTMASKCNIVALMAGGACVQTVNSSDQAAIRIFNVTQNYNESTNVTILQASGTNSGFLWPVFVFGFDYPIASLANSWAIQLSCPSGTGPVSYPIFGSCWIQAQELMG